MEVTVPLEIRKGSSASLQQQLRPETADDLSKPCDSTWSLEAKIRHEPIHLN
jgi:hypothetical protein